MTPIRSVFHVAVCLLLTTACSPEAGAGAGTGAVAADDAVVRMCEERDSAEVCKCAAAALQEQTSAEDYVMYEAVAEDYLARLAEGEGRVDAWMAASRTAAEDRGESPVGLMGRTNEIGEILRQETKACGG